MIECCCDLGVELDQAMFSKKELIIKTSWNWMLFNKIGYYVRNILLLTPDT